MSHNTSTKLTSDEIKNILLGEAEIIEAERRELGYFADRNPIRQGAGRFPKGKIYGS